MAPYSTARDEYQGDIGIYLDANENPYDNGVNRYPDPYQKALKERISEIKGIPLENIFIGNGSDEAIDLVFRVFCDPRIDNVITIAPSYGMYRVAAAMNDVEVREVLLGENFKLSADALFEAADGNTKAIFLCSPNNPSGNLLERTELGKILNNFDGIVVLDEAYIDFADDAGFISQLPEYEKLIILQTFSKAWAMAGLRVGLAFADKRITELFTRIKYPYNINVVTQKIVLDMLQQDVVDQVDEVVEQRKIVIEALSKMAVVKHIYPSDSNFILVKMDEPIAIYSTLIDNGIIVRDRSRIAGCEGCLRITIGTPEQNSKLIEIMQGL
jgi:histidinol-phosphate aminotransferase